MIRGATFLALIVMTALGGCSPQAADCGAAQSIASVVPLIQERVQERTRQRIRSADASRNASLSRVRAVVTQAALTIIDIRTTQSDPNSTRRFCVGRLKATIPAQVLQEAERGRQAANAGTISELADGADIDRNADAFTMDIEYSVQPTDDGGRIYAEVENSDTYVNFLADVFASYLMRPAIERARQEQDRAAAEQQRLQQAQQREQETALAEQRAATLDQARSELRLSEQNINAVWGAIPQDVRRQLLEMQRAWNRRKGADCRIESAGVSTDTQEREAARFRCETRMNNERSNFLRQYARY